MEEERQGMEKRERIEGKGGEKTATATAMLISQSVVQKDKKSISSCHKIIIRYFIFVFFLFVCLSVFGLNEGVTA